MRADITTLIRNRIIHLAYRPGEALNEKKLAQEFAVSRTPVREALRGLTAEGLVTLTPNLGARVSEINLRDFRELIEMRLILERGVARLVARYAAPEDIEAMEQLHRRLESETTDDLDRLTDFDTEFHYIIRRAAHNQLLEKQMAMIQARFTWVMRLISYKPTVLIMEIANVTDAMKRRDAATLERLLVEHVEIFIEGLRQQTMKNFF